MKKRKLIPKPIEQVNREMAEAKAKKEAEVKPEIKVESVAVVKAEPVKVNEAPPIKVKRQYKPFGGFDVPEEIKRLHKDVTFRWVRIDQKNLVKRIGEGYHYVNVPGKESETSIFDTTLENSFKIGDTVLMYMDNDLSASKREYIDNRINAKVKTLSRNSTIKDEIRAIDPRGTVDESLKQT